MHCVLFNTLWKGRQQRWQTKFRYSVVLACLALVVLASGQSAAAQLSPQSQAPDMTNRRLAIAPDPIVQGMINQVQSSTLYNYVAGLSGESGHELTIGGALFDLETRSTDSSTYIAKATQYAYEHFQSSGLTVSYHTWQYSGSPRRNVVAEQAGTNPNCLYLLTAHVDDTSQTPGSDAPGADDNASGTTGVLVAADILHQYQFTCTLRYVLFTGEEEGLLGSEAYAQAAAERGDPILGVLNLDMLAYNSPGTEATIEMDIRLGQTGNPDRALSNMVTDVIDAYDISLMPLVYEYDEPDSDHYSFWEAGYPAVMVSEDWDDHTPYYHKATDTVGTLNMTYFTNYVKAVIGAMAHLGQVVSAPLDFHTYLPVMVNH